MPIITIDELKKMRKKVGLTQTALAENAGVSQPLIARIESGDLNPTLSTINKIFDAIKNHEASGTRAKDIMTKRIISINKKDTIK